MEDKDIGKKLKNLRQRRGISLRSLAGVSGVTLGAVSQIENGKSSPSISTMKKLLTALGTTMGRFFNDDADNIRDRFIFPKATLVPIDTGKGIRYYALPGGNGDRAIQLLYAEYEPGAATGPDTLTHEGEECGFCLDGKAEFTVGGTTEVIGKGDAYYFKSAVPHSFKNASKKMSRFISVCTPPTF